ncbi:MAG: membrane protein insertion efficiency factor YidD [Vicinamibacterales bacterium]
MTTTTPSIDATTHARPRAGGQPGIAAVLALLRAYKIIISPLFTGSCRFHPSCSDYMGEAVRLHGAIKGVWLGLRRLARCQPLGNHGFDPVPRS